MILFSAKKTGFSVMIAAVILAIARTMIVLYNMEQKTPESEVYHMPTNAYVNTFGAIVVILVLAVAALAIYSGRGKTVTLNDKNEAVSVGALLLAFSLIGTVLIFCINHIKADKTPTYIGAFVAIFAVCSAFKFLISGLKGGESEKNSLAGAALFPILLTVFRLLGDFIRTGAEVLSYLCDRIGQTVEASQILTQIWGDDSFYNLRSLNVFISRLRRRLIDDKEVEIISVRSVGYRLKA